MAHNVLDGKALSGTIKEEIKLEVDKLKEGGYRAPHLSAILVGNNPASEAYMKNKVRSCEQVGFSSDLIRKEADISQEELIALVEVLNEDDNVDGFIVQLPLPDHIDETEVLLKIDPKKDVDGFHPYNFGCMAQGLDGFLPATPHGIHIHYFLMSELLTLAVFAVFVAFRNLAFTGRKRAVRCNWHGTGKAAVVENAGPQLSPLLVCRSESQKRHENFDSCIVHLYQKICGPRALRH